MFRLFPAIGALLLLTGCGQGTPNDTGATLNDLARDYVSLELAMGWHDPAHVDAYFGPPELRQLAEKEQLPLNAIDKQAAALSENLAAWPLETAEPITASRVAGLRARLRALRTRIALNRGQAPGFDEEAGRLFGVTPPEHDADHYAAIIQQIDELLPGNGPVAERVVAFRKKFVVPPERLTDVFDAAIAECRRRTLGNIELPANESFRLEYVTDKPWSGYNWYQGNAQSLIQINTDLPVYVHRAVELGCHEGYPGHHTFNLLLEKNLVDERNWIEFTLYPLFSPQSLIAEGSANYGIRLAFPGDERVQFEKDVLFPLAGLDPSVAGRYFRLQNLLDELDYADIEAARGYLDGNMNATEAAQWLIDYKLISPERARQRIEFIETYRSYVINYNLGQDMVAAYIERGSPAADLGWSRFAEMLSSPMLPADLPR